MSRTSEVLAFTPTYGARLNFLSTFQEMRSSSGLWFDWFVAAGAASQPLREGLEKLFAMPEGQGIQYLTLWDENRGQHHATKLALDIARSEGYRWLLRLDDDVQHKTKRWLKKMVDRVEELRRLAKDPRDRIVAAPRIVGLKYPPEPAGDIQIGQSYPVKVMQLLGGAVRLHPVQFFDGYVPPLYDPVGRGDPQSIHQWMEENEGLEVQFPDIRVVHRTELLEEEDTPEQAHLRRMSKFWCYLGPIEDPEVVA